MRAREELNKLKFYVHAAGQGKGTMDQDVTEISLPPMDAQGLVVKYMRSGWVFSQNAEIRQEDFSLGCSRKNFLTLIFSENCTIER